MARRTKEELAAHHEAQAAKHRRAARIAGDPFLAYLDGSRKRIVALLAEHEDALPRSSQEALAAVLAALEGALERALEGS